MSAVSAVSSVTPTSVACQCASMQTRHQHASAAVDPLGLGRPAGRSARARRCGRPGPARRHPSAAARSRRVEEPDTAQQQRPAPGLAARRAGQAEAREQGQHRAGTAKHLAARELRLDPAHRGQRARRAAAAGVLRRPLGARLLAEAHRRSPVVAGRGGRRSRPRITLFEAQPRFRLRKNDRPRAAAPVSPHRARAEPAPNPRRGCAHQMRPGR